MSKLNNWHCHPTGKTVHVYAGTTEALNDKFCDTYHFHHSIIHNKKLSSQTIAYINGCFDGYMVFPYFTYATPDSSKIGFYEDTTFRGTFNYGNNNGYYMYDTPGESYSGRGYGRGDADNCGDVDGSDTIDYELDDH